MYSIELRTVAQPFLISFRILSLKAKFPTCLEPTKCHGGPTAACGGNEKQKANTGPETANVASDESMVYTSSNFAASNLAATMMIILTT
jgi:hypothetical protein